MKSEQRANFSDQLVTPDLAKQWLAHWNTKNRRFKIASYKLYTAEMKAGAWTRGSRLVFYKDGVLCDGQNRLQAVVLSGISCLFDVLVGASLDEGAVIDTGAKRSVQDALQLKGAPAWIANKDCVALVNNINRLVTNSNSTRLPHHVVRRFATENEQWMRPVLELAFKGHKRKLTSTMYYASLAAALRNGESYTEIFDFHAAYFSGECYERTKNSAIRLREYIMGFEGAPWTLPAGYDTTKKTQRAIKAFIERQSISKLYTPGEYIYMLPTVVNQTQ